MRGLICFRFEWRKVRRVHGYIDMVPFILDISNFEILKPIVKISLTSARTFIAFIKRLTLLCVKNTYLSVAEELSFRCLSK